nr:MAG TPA: hypothetical protein [Caudoviricetes sp.]
MHFLYCNLFRVAILIRPLLEQLNLEIGKLLRNP